MKCRICLSLFLLPVLLLLVGCAVNLQEYSEQGYGIVIFPDDGGSAVWNLQGEEGGLAPKFTDLGGSYRAAILAPGVYELSGFYNVAKRSILGRGDKDLDYADRQRGSNIPPAELENNLGLALVKRLPIKEERGEGKFGAEHVVDVSSEYRMKLSLPQGAELAWFKLGAGQVLLLPSLRGEMELNEKSCTRHGFILGNHTPYILSFNPEDLQLLEWYCPLNKLFVTLIPARLDELKEVADPKKLSPALMNKLEVRDLHFGQSLQKAARIDGGAGRIKYVLSGQ